MGLHQESGPRSREVESQILSFPKILRDCPPQKFHRPILEHNPPVGGEFQFLPENSRFGRLAPDGGVWVANFNLWLKISDSAELVWRPCCPTLVA